MTIQERNVAVKQLPEILNLKQGQKFLGEIESSIHADRPCIVLDCSHVRQLDRSVIYLLLCCLEEAMKRNGDVKLAALPPGAAALLEVTGANRLFSVYDTTAEAVDSFHQIPAGAVSQAPVPVGSHLEPESRTEPL